MQKTTLVASGLIAPYGLTVDTAGNVYFADANHNTVSEYNATTQQVATLVSSGLSGPYDLAMDATNALLISDFGTAAIKKLTLPTPPSLGTSSELFGPNAGSGSVIVSVAAGASWSATTAASWIHLTNASGSGPGLATFNFDLNSGVTRSGTIVFNGGALTLSVTQAGGGYVAAGQASLLISSAVSTLGSPLGLALDSAGNVYIADFDNNGIQKWSAATHQASTIVSSGLSLPAGVAVDRQGNVYIGDSGDNTLKKWNAATNQLTTLVSSGLNQPYGVALDSSGNVYIADSQNSAIKEWNAQTQTVTALISSGLHIPLGVAVDAAGNLYIADTFNNAIKKWNAATGQLTTLVPSSSGLVNPSDVAVDGAGNVYFTTQAVVEEWSPVTNQVTTLVSESGQFYGITVDGSGNVYFDDSEYGLLEEWPNAFINTTGVSEPAAAGNDALPAVLPASALLNAVSDQSWLTITSQTNGVVSFSFAANTSTAVRVAHITLLGQTVAVTQAAGAQPLTPQTIDFTVSSPQTVGIPLYLYGFASSLLPVTFSSSTPAVCTVAGTVATFSAPGSCTLIASQSGDSTYAPAPNVSQTVTVLPGQTISFAPLPNQALGTQLTLSATASSGLPTSFGGSGSSNCSVSGNTATFYEVGSCTLFAYQQGDGVNYGPAPAVQQTFDVVGLGQTTALFGSGAGTGSDIISLPGAYSWAAATTAPWIHLIVASGVGSGPATFTYDANPGVTRTGTISFAGDGVTQTLTITQAGSSYTPASQLTTLVSNGLLNNPQGVAVDQSGNVYIADTYNQAIEVWNASTGLKTLLSNQQVASALQFFSVNQFVQFNPIGVAVDPLGNVYIADPMNGILEWNAANQNIMVLASGQNGQNFGPNITTPAGVALDNSGNIYFSDNFNRDLVEVGPSLRTVTPLNFNPSGLAVDGAGNIYVADPSDQFIAEWNPASQQITSVVSGLTQPSAVAVDGAGNVYFTDGSTVKEWNSASGQLITLSSAAINPTGVAVDGSGNLYITDNLNNALEELTRVFVSTAGLNEPASAGTDQTLPVLGSTGALNAMSDQSWLTITLQANGIVSFAFTTNNTGSARTAHITVFGQSVTVTQASGDNLISQAITFGAIANQTVGSTLSLNATASSGLAVSFASSTPLVCSTSGNSAMLLAAGTCSLTASQAGNATYAAATSVTQSFTVSLAPQTITFGAIPTQRAATSIALGATASSGLPVSYASSTPLVCSISGTSATLLTAGTCNLTASQPGNATYAAATPVTQSFTVSLAPQTITFAAIPTQTAVTSITLTATASSGLPVSLASANNAICTISGSIATLLKTGTCKITASQAGNATYAAAASVSQSFTVNPAPQTITFGPIATQLTGKSLKLSATSSSGLAVTYASSTTSVCTVSGNTASFLTAGTCTITASQAGNATYAAATPVSQSFGVLLTQTIAFANIPTQLVGTPLTLIATATSGLAVTYSSSTSAVCTVSGGIATFLAPGTCTLTASQSGNTTYAAAASVTNSFSVDSVQTITFNSIGSQVVGTPLVLSATASSGLAVTYASSTTSICTVSGSKATFLAPGTCSITASQAGNKTYAAAAPVTQSFTVLQTQTISFGTIATQTAGTPLTLTAVATSGLPVSYTSSTAAICTVSGNTASLLAPGTCTIVASQPGNSAYAPAASVSRSFSVVATQSITFGPVASQLVGTPLTLTASATSGLTISYSSSTTSVCTVSGSKATFKAAGACTITASQAGNAAYAAAQPVSQTFSVLQTQTISFGTIPTQTGGTQLTLGAAASSTLPVSYSSSTPSVCTVSGSTATLLAAGGTCTITASQSGNATFAPAPSVSRSFKVLATQTIAFGSIATQKVGKALTLAAAASSGLAVSYVSSTTSVCTISGSVAKFAVAGTCTITASQAGNGTYAAAAPVAQSFSVTN